MKKIYLYIIIGLILTLIGSHFYTYNKGFKNGKQNEREASWIANQSVQNAISQAASQIAQVNASINNSVDTAGCFDRVWPTGVVKTVNNLVR